MGAIAPTPPLAMHPAAPEGAPAAVQGLENQEIAMIRIGCCQLEFNLPT